VFTRAVCEQARATCGLTLTVFLRPHRRRELASDGVRYADARSSVGRRVQSVAKLRLEWYGGVFLLLQQRSKHSRGMVNPILTVSSSLLSKKGRSERSCSPETCVCQFGSTPPLYFLTCERLSGASRAWLTHFGRH